MSFIQLLKVTVDVTFVQPQFRFTFKGGKSFQGHFKITGSLYLEIQSLIVLLYAVQGWSKGLNVCLKTSIMESLSCKTCTHEHS